MAGNHGEIQNSWVDNLTIDDICILMTIDIKLVCVLVVRFAAYTQATSLSRR